LSGLKKRIEGCEEEITRLEFDVAQDVQRMTEASIKGKALDIKKLSQAIRENKARIDRLFAELEAATNEHDAKAKEFDDRLACLEQAS
jgi:predicted RNase H-like nuclease (RuvC/YqgF family)